MSDEASGRNTLWAPWRIGFILGSKEESVGTPTPDYAFLPGAAHDCFLCQAVADRAPGAAAWRYVPGSTTHTITILNRYPYNNGHLLIAPQRHVADLSDLKDTERLELMQELTRWKERLDEVLRPDGFNIGINLGHVAGAGLPGHLHIHIVPRWNGDTNFMAAIGGIRVIPQSLDALFEKLVRS
jgi:Diadenosine tetraphosphate (Ap4A) hydrolase and other HIT family hydrolases